MLLPVKLQQFRKKFPAKSDRYAGLNYVFDKFCNLMSLNEDRAYKMSMQWEKVVLEALLLDAIYGQVVCTSVKHTCKK